MVVAVPITQLEEMLLPETSLELVFIW